MRRQPIDHELLFVAILTTMACGRHRPISPQKVWTKIHQVAGVKGIDIFKGHNYLPGHVPSIVLQPRIWHPFLIEGCEEINSDQLRDLPLMKSKQHP